MYRAAVVMTALTVAPGNAVVAQLPIDTAMGRLSAGQMVRVHTPDGRRIESQVRAIDRDPLRLWLVDQEAPLQASSIDSLWVRGRSVKTGAIVGAVGVGVPWFAFLTWLCYATSDRSGCDHWDDVTAWTFAGVAGGALIGTAVGAAIPKWRLRYPRWVRATAVPAAPAPGIGFIVAINF